MIEIAEQKRVAAKITNVRFECAALHEVAESAERYDVVLGLSILHLLEDWRGVLAQVYGLLEPGGVFISSTACMGDSMAWLRYLLPLGRALRVLPRVVVFSAAALEQALVEAGFAIDVRWHAGGNQAVFLVARRPARA